LALCSKYIWPAVFLLSVGAAGSAHAAGPVAEEELPKYDIGPAFGDNRHFLKISTNFDFVGLDYRQSNSVDDVECERGFISSSFLVAPGKTKKRPLNLSRQGSPTRALYEWHICFVIDDVVYRAWRGFDPGPNTDLEVSCFIDEEQIARQDTSKYLCRTVRATQYPGNHSEYAIHCWEADKCKSFDTKGEFDKWMSLNPLSRDEYLQIAAAILGERQLKEAGSLAEPADYYLSLEGEDLPAKFLEKYSSDKLRLHPGSEFKKDAQKNRGTLISIGRFEQIEKGVARGSMSFYCGPLCASGHTVIVEKVKGAWTFKSSREDWIS
jgi:hypothetical protein